MWNIIHKYLYIYNETESKKKSPKKSLKKYFIKVLIKKYLNELFLLTEKIDQKK